MAKNGNPPKGVDLNWYETIKPIVEAHAWGTADLFSTFGMASLPGLTIDAAVADLPGVLPLSQTTQKVEASMARPRLVLRPL